MKISKKNVIVMRSFIHIKVIFITLAKGTKDKATQIYCMICLLVTKTEITGKQLAQICQEKKKIHLTTLMKMNMLFNKHVTV